VETLRTNLENITFFTLPICLGFGWFIHLTWIFGIEHRFFPIFLIIVASILLIYLLYGHNWKLKDIRWFFSPLLVIVLAFYLPWWSYTTSQHTDTFYHIIEAKNFFGDMDWVPKHQGMDFLFRPPLVPGFFALELALNPENTWVIFTPLILFTATLWQLQHLAERWTTKSRASLVVLIFLLLPVTRYWGQLPLLDVAVAGMFIVTIHSLILSNENQESKKLALLIGLFGGIMFLTKYVFIYSLGLVLWLFLLDRNKTRALYCLSGWLIVVLPFLLYHQISEGNMFSAISVQSNFAINGITENLGSYNSSRWYEEYESQIFWFGILFVILGISLLGLLKPKELLSIFIFTFPLICLHAYILDFGTLRYHTPWLSISVVFLAVMIPKDFQFQSTLKIDWNKISKICQVLSLGCMILIAGLHVSTINEEKKHYEELIPERDRAWNFYLDASEMVPENSILLTSKYIPLALYKGLNTERYVNSDNPISDSIELYGVTHVLTSNLETIWCNTCSWEKEWLPLLGNDLIEPINIHQDGADAAVLWEVNNDTWKQIHNKNNGTIYGNMVLLENGETIEFEVNSTIKWISVQIDTSIIDVMNYYIKDINITDESCSNFIKNNGICNIKSNEKITSNENQKIYLWIFD